VQQTRNVGGKGEGGGEKRERRGCLWQITAHSNLYSSFSLSFCPLCIQRGFDKKFARNGAEQLQCTLVVWYSVCTTMTNFSCVSSTNVMMVLVSSTSTNGAVIKRIFMLAAPILINRSMTNHCAGVSGNGNIINPRWRPN
jgi:hypothetical protein